MAVLSPVALPSASLRVAEVVSALSQALDLGSGSTRWHSVRTCILGMRIAAELRLPHILQGDLYYALLLKDAGCSSNASSIYHAFASDDIAAKRDVKKTDFTRLNWETLQYALTHMARGKPFAERVRVLLSMAAARKRHAREVTAIRCERGAAMARLMGLPEGTAEAIGAFDEHWNGLGYPNGWRGHEIPIASRIILLAQVLDVFYTGPGPAQALEVAKRRSGAWFDPDAVKAASSLAKRGALWSDLDSPAVQSLALNLEPGRRMLAEGDLSLDAVCQAFAQIVDAKSPFTYNHSNGVANSAVAIARTLQFPPARVLFLRHAALLHDLGKMAVSNAILEKAGPPDQAEWQILREHPVHTWNILRSIGGFEELSEVAASHHEKLNGGGYYRGLTADQLSTDARILVVADIFDALSAKRPYRDALPLEQVFALMRKDAPHALDPVCLEALEQSGCACDQSFVGLQALEQALGKAHSPAPGALAQASSYQTLR